MEPFLPKLTAFVVPQSSLFIMCVLGLWGVSQCPPQLPSFTHFVCLGRSLMWVYINAHVVLVNIEDIHFLDGIMTLSCYGYHSASKK